MANKPKVRPPLVYKTLKGTKAEFAHFQKYDRTGPIDDPFMVAYMDGYHFGDRMLEQVPFKVTVNDDHTLTVQFAQVGMRRDDYIDGLNQDYWLEEALAYAEDERDIYCSTAGMNDKNFDVGLEKI